VVACLAKVAVPTKHSAHLRGGPSAVSPSEKGRALRGLLCWLPPSGPISTNSLAPTSWKNPRPHGKDTISRRRSHYGPGVNCTASVETCQPFGFGRPAFGGDRCRGEYSGGEHTTSGVFEVSLEGLGASAQDMKALRRIQALIAGKAAAAQQEQEVRPSSSQAQPSQQQGCDNPTRDNSVLSPKPLHLVIKR
jgi:hypothetical protein